MEKHFDFVGNELFTGDLVCFTTRTESEFMYGVVISCTEKTVKLMHSMSSLYYQERIKLRTAYLELSNKYDLNSNTRHALTHEDRLYTTTRMNKKRVFKYIQNYDGYHTMDELYDHRAALFAYIVNNNKNICWKSTKHHDGTMYPGMFIVGMNTPYGQISYHYDLYGYWDKFDCVQLDTAPEWDGHTPADVVHRLTLLSKKFDNEDRYCKSCKGTGYLKSYCDEPDRCCPDCRGSGLTEDSY